MVNIADINDLFESEDSDKKSNGVDRILGAIATKIEQPDGMEKLKEIIQTTAGSVGDIVMMKNFKGLEPKNTDVQTNAEPKTSNYDLIIKILNKIKTFPAVVNEGEAERSINSFKDLFSTFEYYYVKYGEEFLKHAEKYNVHSIDDLIELLEKNKAIAPAFIDKKINELKKRFF